jgi:hypothetical protein
MGPAWDLPFIITPIRCFFFNFLFESKADLLDDSIKISVQTLSDLTHTTRNPEKNPKTTWKRGKPSPPYHFSSSTLKVPSAL